MLNIRKRFFLLLTIVGLLFGIAACTNNDDYVRLSFDNDVYEVKVGQTIDVTPIVNKGSNVGAVTIEYTSYDDQIASYSNGKLQGLRVGETVIKVVCSEKPVAYDVATVRVVANSLPEVEFEPLQQNMLKGTTQTLKYHFVPEYGNALMSFTSANPEIATIDENGVITGVAKGTAVIIARATDELDSSQYRDYTFVVEVLEADFAITYELNGGTNDPTNPAGYNVLNLPIILKDATKLGHNFVGWYDNPEFSGSPITEIAANSTGDMTLYAKWEVSVFDITYELNGGINASENPDSYDVNKLPLVLGEPTKTGYNFLGWYLDDEKIDSIVEGTTGEIKLVAQWEIATYNITFDLVGGSWQDLTGIEWPYNRDRNQMVADFIVDFNKHSGKTVAADGSDFFARSWMADGSSAGYKFLTSTEYGSKWGWLLDFINDNRLANGKTALNENDNQAEARGELHNFLNACAPGDKGGNASYGCDYSTEEGTTGFWLYMVDLEEVSVPKTYTVESEDIILPEIAYKMGYTFLGWFLNGEKVEKIVKGTTGDLNFVAEWEIVEYTIEYNLNGGLFDIYLYSSREEMVDDFLTDAMAYYNKDKKPNCMVDDSGTQVGFANVFTAIYGIFSSEEYGAKWAWLKEYIIYTATDAKASLESGSEAYWRYSLGAFLFEDHRASWPASADYTNDELANGFWSLLLKEGAVGPQYTYTVNDEVILLTPTKEGSVFLGWFLNGEKIEKISKGTTGNLVLEAKWYNPDVELDIEYQLDGGVLPEGAPTTFVAKDGLAILPTPIKVGYMFKGWYEDIECTKEVTSIASGRSEGVVLYALWELETYKIEYETNGGEFLTDSVAPLYATFDELVLEFINDYSSFTGISGITAESFYGKSNQYGLYGFFKNEEMATKWNWLLNFVADMATEVGYSGKAYLMLSAGAANFNKYSRSNFAAFLQQTHLTKISPISMNFENVDSEALWAVCPTKDIQIGIEAQYEYTILDLPLELATPNKEGATFIGWYTNSDLKNGKIDKLTVDNIGNIKLYARWSDSTIHFDTFNIHYELDGGVLEEGAPTSYVEETGVALKGATRPGYTFQGWYLDAECTKGVTEITAQDKGDITLYACWEAVTYTVTYEVGEGALPVETVRVSGYDNLEQIIEDLLKDYSSYTGVTYNTPADLGTSAWPSAADRNFGTFYLSNVNGVNMYEKYAWFLEYLLAVNTSGEYPRILAKYKNPATCKEVDDETYAFYYAFKGFVQAMQYRSGNAYWETANYADEAILNKALDFAPDAVYEEKPVSAEFTLETLPFELPIPTAPEGQKFVGWYQNSEFTGSAISAIEEGTIGDQTLYAKYESSDVEVKHSIEYVLNGATLSENAEVQYIQGVGLLITATAFKEGYEFKGWYLDSNYSKEITKIDENSIGKVTLYAKLVIKTFEIHLVGTDLTTPLILEYGALLPTPVKEGHIFKGWYDNPELTGNPITIIESSVKNDITLYAKWTAYNYKNINYVLDGGTLSEDAPTNYVVTVGVDLSNVVPTKDGYKFLGWFDNAEGLGNPITEISKDAEEDITLYALWQDETINFDVTYVLNGGNTKWDSRDALIAEFLSDFSSIAGKTITAANFTTAAREAEFNALIKDDAMWAKWKWLFEFIASTDKHEKAPDFYNKVLNDRDGSDPDNKWFLTRDFAGFVNKTIGNFWFSVSPVDYSLFVNADGFWNLIETEYKDVDTNTLLTPYRPYYVFEGWYDNPELTGNPVKVIESDCTLYAKWSKQTVTLTYVIGDVDATIDQPEVLVHVSDSFDLVTPTYDDRYLKFNGWYLEPECINLVTKVNEYTNSDLMVYASWTEIDGYTINYVLNGGSLIYEDRDALLADFLKDYNEAMGKSYQTTADIPTGNFADIDYHTFFTKVLSDGTNIRGKWLWLAEYLLELSKRDLASNNCNVLGLTALINNNAYTGDATYGLSYAFRAFLIGTTIRPGSSYSSVDHSIYENAHGFWDKLSAAENTEYLNNKGTVTLPTAYLENYKFVGWYTNPEFTGEVVTTVEDTITVYAKFVEATPVESVSIDNKITELKRYETYQLEWSINPSNANIQAVKFESSDTSVATVDNKGLITAVSNGTVTIKMTSLSPSGKTDEFTFEVYSPDHFDINYETNSYVEIGKSILLLADYVKRDGSKVNLVWSSLTPEIASVDAGAVTGLKAGQAVIRVALADDANIYQDFVVTVLDSNLSDALKYVLSAHESNAFLSYDLGIGAGTPAYYRDIVGSVSKLLYNEPLTINDQYYATANANEKNHGGKMSSIEFITVHYTGNMAKGSTASANANYFATNTSTSIHYVTGNDGVFSVLDDSYVAYHAGDGTSVKFEWFPTGVTYKDGDPVYPVFGITANSKFSINGTETTISVPEGTTAATKKVTDSKWINDMGLAFKIVDGQYYMGTTWWCYSQVAEGRICSKGGNLNSIGIESAVNPESNLWYTWQRTAQLVAKLMLENDLDITRVKGHHFYSAKDCPQPLLENDLEIWWKFIEMVEHEYDMLTKYKDYQFTFELDTETTAVNNNGRVVEQPLYTEVVTYTVTIDNGTTSETITLSTIVEGMYCK